MPELPEVETVLRGLAPRLEGRRIAQLSVRCAELRRPLPARFAERLRGRLMRRLERRGKYLLFHLDDGHTLIGHLGMSGRLFIDATHAREPARHDHLLFETDDGTRFVFNDTRRFGLFDIAETAALDRHPLLRRLGPDPLGDAFDGATLGAALAGRKAAIKTLLLDQGVVAGIGNIYACESLFRARLSPRRKGASVAGARAERLAHAVKTVLNEAIAAGGSSLRDYVQASGEPGYFQHRFAVYRRDGEPCPTGAEGHLVRRIVQGGRATFFCPRCQR
jgi:formamidopyrimidine-DNA glycosylase